MLLNSTRSKTSGNICAATNSRSPSSTTTTTSLIKPATHGTSLNEIQCASRQSPPERGRLSMIRAVGISRLGGHQTLDVDLALANLGEVVIHLHPKPGVGSAADSFLKFHGHFRRDPAAPRNEIVKLLPGNAEALCRSDNRNFQFVERVTDQLAGVRWIFHLHFFSLSDSPQGQHRMPCHPRTEK